MSIDMYTTEKTKCTVYHDLNFQKPRYETIQTIQIKNPSQALLQILRETGPVASDDDPKIAKARKANDGKKRKAGYDFEKMADGLTKLNEDDLLHVIQLIHDHKTDETYTKNDMDNGEFSVDLFTMPDHLVRLLWDFLVIQPSPSSNFTYGMLIIFSGGSEACLCIGSQVDVCSFLGSLSVCLHGRLLGCFFISALRGVF